MSSYQDGISEPMEPQNCNAEWYDFEFEAQPTVSFQVIDGGRSSAADGLDYSERRVTLQLVT